DLKFVWWRDLLTCKYWRSVSNYQLGSFSIDSSSERFAKVKEEQTELVWSVRKTVLLDLNYIHTGILSILKLNAVIYSTEVRMDHDKVKEQQVELVWSVRKRILRDLNNVDFDYSNQRGQLIEVDFPVKFKTVLSNSE
ncbi:hypothetical protein P5673_020857, partial [Acropora cervicornis]